MAMILYRKVEGCDSSNPIKIQSQISSTIVKVFAVYMRERQDHLLEKIWLFTIIYRNVVDGAQLDWNVCSAHGKSSMCI